MTDTVTDAPQQGNLRERKKAATRQALIDAARTLISSPPERGWDLADVAEIADVSQRTFFRYFPTKAAVVFAACQVEVDQGDLVDAKTDLLRKAVAADPSLMGDLVVMLAEGNPAGLAKAGDEAQAVLVGTGV
jgi:AcrR family transcriptional regulator